MFRSMNFIYFMVKIAPVGNFNSDVNSDVNPNPTLTLTNSNPNTDPNPN